MTVDYTYYLQGQLGGLPYNNTDQKSLKLMVGYCEEIAPFTNYTGTCADTTVTA